MAPRRRRPPPAKRARKRTAPVDVDASAALTLATAQSENVFLFVPNLIGNSIPRSSPGYARIILAGLSLHFMSSHPLRCTIAYCASCLLDAFDGYAARRLGQSSKFGAVLDMVTDRCTTACLLCYLFSVYPDYALLFQFLIALDFSSHYMHMYSSLVTGSSSHKHIEIDVSRILRWYYNNPVSSRQIPLHLMPLELKLTSYITKLQSVLFFVCAANELFFVSLYLMKWTAEPIRLPEFIPWSPSLTYAKLLARCTFPVCFIKNGINIVQLWKASKILVGVDIAERRLDLKSA
ncbi:CDP-alcohol phosphatidyltransferase-domain-containing protein [Mycena capillaripes]|nr:CDP-alcohol phosphatidyltransferase-domain-containing protein [Mycena capillaripes]